MKYTTTLLFTAVLVISAQAQTYLRTGYYQLWDTIASTWNDDLRIVHEFADADGRWLNFTLDSLSNGTWEHRRRTTLSYDASDRLDSVTIEVWNGQLSQWENSELKISEYGADSFPTAQQDHVWDGGSWDQTQRYVHSYDVNDRRIETVNHDWTGAWEPVSRNTYQRDMNGNAIVERYDELLPGMIWETRTIDSSSFNGSGQKLMTTVWSNAFGSFLPSGSTEWTYDGNGAIETVTSFLLFPFPEPVPTYLETRTSAGDNLLNQTFQRNHDLPASTPTWENEFRWIYDPLITGVSEIAQPTVPLLAYPNPTSSAVTLEYNSDAPVEVIVFTGSGMQVGPVQRFGIGERMVMDVSGLTDGPYIVQCASNGSTARSVLVVQH